MKEILRTVDPTAIPFAVAILHGEGIECFELDVYMSTLEGALGIMPRRLMVADADYAAALLALKDNDLLVSDNKE